MQRACGAVPRLFAKVAWKKGEERKQALQDLCEFAKAGRLRASLRPLDEREKRQWREAAKAGGPL